MLMDIVGGYGQYVLCMDRKYLGFLKSAFYLDEQSTMFDGSMEVVLMSFQESILH
jgi:hypothetical protein